LLPNTHFQNSFIGEIIFLLLSQRHELDEAEKVVYSSALSHFFLSSMYKIIGEAILPNNFFKTAKLYLESCSRSFFFKKNNFTSEAELCQTES
jgi:hypothetical protein